MAPPEAGTGAGVVTRPPGAPAPAPAPARPRPDRLVPLLILAVAAAVTVRSRHFLLDDGAIDTRYIRNLAGGHGWVWNHGEHVNGVTSTAYVLASSLATLPVRNAALAQHLLGGLLAGIAGIAAWRLLRDAGAGPAAVGVGLLLPVLPALTHTWGLETPGYLAALFAWPQLRGRAAWLLAGLGPLIRPDGVLISVGIAVRETVSARRVPWRGLALAVAVVAPWLFYSEWRFHTVVPASLGAKIVQGRYATGGFTYPAGWRSELERWAGGSSTGAVLLVAAAAAGLLLAVARRRAAVLEVAAVVLVQQAVFALVPVPSYRWYYVPLLALMLVLIGLAAGELLAAARLPGAARAVAVAAATVVLFAVSWRQAPARNDPRERSYAEIAAALADRPPGSVVCSEVGTLGADLPLDRAVVDISGLTTEPTLSDPRHRGVFWAKPSRYFVFHWFTGRGTDRAAAAAVDRLDPALGAGRPFGSEAPFLTDRRFAGYRLLMVVRHAPYAALVVVDDPAVHT